MFPTLDREAQPLSAAPVKAELAGGDSAEGSLRATFPASSPSEPLDNPWLGLGLVETNATPRFNERTAQALLDDAMAWCRDDCTGVRAGSLPRLASRPATATERQTVYNTMSAALSSQLPGVALSLTLDPVTSVLVSGRPEEMFGVELEVTDDVRKALPGKDLPSSVHFLVVRAPNGSASLLKLDPGEYTHGLGETGELVATVDLDEDGTDELLLEWSYHEGRWLKLAVREKGRFVVLGSVGDGL